MQNQKITYWHQKATSLLAMMLLSSLATPFAHAAPLAPQQPGMTKKKKLLLIGGAALLYYLYKKHQAKQAHTNMGSNAPANRQQTPQLYRSKNGGVYYRDSRGKAVWLTVPNQAMSIDSADVQRYAPDYARYRGPAPSAPRNYRTQQFSDFDSNLLQNH